MLSTRLGFFEKSCDCEIYLKKHLILANLLIHKPMII